MFAQPRRRARNAWWWFPGKLRLYNPGVKTREEVLSVIQTWKTNNTPATLPGLGLAPWQILGVLEGVDLSGPLDNAALDDLALRASMEIYPVLRELNTDGLVTLAYGCAS